MTTPKMAGRPRVVAVRGDPLRSLNSFGSDPQGPQPPDLLVVGVDARRIRSKADFAALLRRRKRTALDYPAPVSQIIAVIDHAGHADPWMQTIVHRWALSIHRRIQRARGVDTGVTALLVDWRTSPQLVAERIEELAQRPPGVNAAAVLAAHEIRGQTIAQASTNDFI